MVIQEKKRNGRVSSFVLDTLHVIVGILIVILAVLAFLNPDENRILFPAIFLLAALLNFANGYDRFHNNRGKKKKRFAGAALMTAGVGLFLLCVVSALTIWWVCLKKQKDIYRDRRFARSSMFPEQPSGR